VPTWLKCFIPNSNRVFLIIHSISPIHRYLNYQNINNFQINGQK
jgi:hypothetical protein